MSISAGQPFEQPLGKRSSTTWNQRQFRWARLRRVTFCPFLPEILLGPPISCILRARSLGTFGWPLCRPCSPCC